MQRNLPRMNAIVASQEVDAVKAYFIRQKKNTTCMQVTIKTRKAKNNDLATISKLLKEEQLPTEDLDNELEHFIVAEGENGIVGTIGLEKYGDTGLLRSMIVNTEYRNHGIASRLVKELLDYAKAQNLSSLYLITNTAEDYFARKGFVKIDKEKVAKPVLRSKEFNGLCPASSTIMFQNL